MSKKVFIALLLAVGLLPSAIASQITESFNDITTLSGAGWVIVNNSTNTGGSPTSWFQGDNTNPFGPVSPFIAANFLAGDAGLTSTISLWLISPQVTIYNGETISFFTASTQNAPDRLQVRFSTNGSSSNVGATPTSVGDFTNLLLDINPTLTGNGYPSTFTSESANVSLGGGPVTGRFAFRYFVTDTINNADYIGIDSVDISSQTSGVPEPSTAAIGMLGLAAIGVLAKRRKRN